MSTPTRVAPGGIRALAEFTQAILDTAGEAIVTVDNDGTIRSFNRAAERIFGWTEAELIGAPVDRLMPRPEDTRRADHRSPYARIGGPLLGRGREIVGLCRDGARSPMRPRGPR